MNLARGDSTRDANTDIRRLLDAGYEIRFALAPAWAGSASAPEYMAVITSGTGSDWRGAGASPAEALRSVWPLGTGPRQGGCGHCGGLGCTVAGCTTCAAYATASGDAPDCGVCGYTDPDAISDEGDDLQPYCTACDLNIGIFLGHGRDWHHWRDRGDGGAELVAAGHVPLVAWRGAL